MSFTEEPDIEYQVLPWRANKQAIKSWLLNQGYGDCAEKLTEHVKEGSQLYCMDRETLREMFGSSDGVRLYSQLQKDKPSSEKEAGVAKETEFQVILVGIARRKLCACNRRNWCSIKVKCLYENGL